MRPTSTWPDVGESSLSHSVPFLVSWNTVALIPLLLTCFCHLALASFVDSPGAADNGEHIDVSQHQHAESHALNATWTTVSCHPTQGSTQIPLDLWCSSGLCSLFYRCRHVYPLTDF